MKVQKVMRNTEIYESDDENVQQIKETDPEVNNHIKRLIGRDSRQLVRSKTKRQKFAKKILPLLCVLPRKVINPF
jgi:hypothetical protein